MKYLVHVTAPVITSVDGDNLRGEPRLERNYLGAALASGRDVHSTMPIWHSSATPPSNFHDGINPDWQDDSVLITYGVTASPNITTTAKYYVVHYLDGPNAQNRDKFTKYLPNIVGVCGYRAWNWYSELQKSLGGPNVEFINGPIVPFVDDTADNFNKTNLFWSYRNFWYLAQKEPGRMGSYLGLIASWMSANPNLTTTIMVGQWDSSSIPLDKVGDWARSYPFMKPLNDLGDRVRVIWQVGWHDILSILKETKLIISPPEPLGYPPFEAAMYGIPTIVREDTHPFSSGGKSAIFPEVLTVNNKNTYLNDDFINKTDKLFRDADLFHRHGNAYRQYVKQTSTYEAYIRQLDEMFSRRGWK